MKVKDLLEQSVCIDVYDNVCEELAIAFDGPMKLTEEGEREWEDVLELDVMLKSTGGFVVGIVDVDDEDGVWEEKLERAKDFFESMAGYCTVDEWNLWFKEDE